MNAYSEGWTRRDRYLVEGFRSDGITSNYLTSSENDAEEVGHDMVDHGDCYGFEVTDLSTGEIIYAKGV